MILTNPFGSVTITVSVRRSFTKILLPVVSMAILFIIGCPTKTVNLNAELAGKPIAVFYPELYAVQPGMHPMQT